MSSFSLDVGMILLPVKINITLSPLLWYCTISAVGAKSFWFHMKYYPGLLSCMFYEYPRHEYLFKQLGAYPFEFFFCPDSYLNGGGRCTMSQFTCNGFGLLTPLLTGPNSHLGNGKHCLALCQWAAWHTFLFHWWNSSFPVQCQLSYTMCQRTGVIPTVACLDPFHSDWPGQPFIHINIFYSFRDTVKRMKTQDTGENICET